MATYHVPVERLALHRANPLRWLILPVEAGNPGEALNTAERTAWAILGRHTPMSVWAAVSYVPDFAHMQELRDEIEAISDRKRSLHRERTERLANSFTTFVSSAFA